jgi:vacuolar-type H+-ATPase subunit C/Vma6
MDATLKPHQAPLSVSVIEQRLKDKMVAEFWHIRKQAVEPLATFLDFITYSYMIDNVIFLLTGTRHVLIYFGRPSFLHFRSFLGVGHALL